MFPSFTSFNLICNYNNEIIYNDLSGEINFSGSGIIPFAQSDVITTFLSGIDGDFESVLIHYFTNFIDMYLTELHDAIDSNKKINGKDLTNIKKEINELKKTNDNRVEEFRKTINEMKQNIYSPVLNSVEALPKDELANMSESLIHITSLKRKVSSDLETVGGAIDVAIISKGDGFIWKKRKHYFNPELNPHFFNK